MKLHTDLNSDLDAIVSTGRLLDVRQVADVLGCGRTLVYDLLGRGELNRVKIGRLTRVPSSEVDRYVRRQMGLEDSTASGEFSVRRRRCSSAPTLPFEV
jgi:excisionase family DNA binding protein